LHYPIQLRPQYGATHCFLLTKYVRLVKCRLIKLEPKNFYKYRIGKPTEFEKKKHLEWFDLEIPKKDRHLEFHSSIFVLSLSKSQADIAVGPIVSNQSQTIFAADHLTSDHQANQHKHPGLFIFPIFTTNLPDLINYIQSPTDDSFTLAFCTALTHLPSLGNIKCEAVVFAAVKQDQAEEVLNEININFFPVTSGINTLKTCETVLSRLQNSSSV